MKRPSEAQVRRELKRIGTRRVRMDKQRGELEEATAAALRSAEGVLPTTEAAELVGLSRSTVYEVYRGQRKARQNGRNGKT